MPFIEEQIFLKHICTCYLVYFCLFRFIFIAKHKLLEKIFITLTPRVVQLPMILLDLEWDDGTGFTIIGVYLCFFFVFEGTFCNKKKCYSIL